ncbi:MAG: cytochrome c biogenesis protein CcdA [Armatimonadota bacterium]
MPAENINILTAFLFGILSFVSPCVLPLVPSYLCYITGLSFDQMQNMDKDEIKSSRMAAFYHSIMFFIGFSVVFVLLGASASYLGKLIFAYKNIITKAAGVVIFFFGLYFVGLIKPKFMQSEHKIHLKKRPAGYFGSVIIGMTFAFGWTPCIGPILGAILAIAATEGTVWFGMLLLFVYSLGLGIPFILSALAFNFFLSYSKKIFKYMNKIVFASGILLMLVGVLVFFNFFDKIAQFLIR